MISQANPTRENNPDPTKADLYAMLTDEQLHEYLASPRTDERLRLRLEKEAERRATDRERSDSRPRVVRNLTT